jgi:hypothetical protein
MITDLIKSTGVASSHLGKQKGEGVDKGVGGDRQRIFFTFGVHSPSLTWEVTLVDLYTNLKVNYLYSVLIHFCPIFTIGYVNLGDN